MRLTNICQTNLLGQEGTLGRDSVAHVPLPSCMSAWFDDYCNYVSFKRLLQADCLTEAASCACSTPTFCFFLSPYMPVILLLTDLRT